MHELVTWKTRPLSPEQTTRMMGAWAAMQASEAQQQHADVICRYFHADGSGGFTVANIIDPIADASWLLEWSLVLKEFFEMDRKIVLTLDEALPAMMAAVGRITAP